MERALEQQPRDGYQDETYRFTRGKHGEANKPEHDSGNRIALDIDAHLRYVLERDVLPRIDVEPELRAK